MQGGDCEELERMTIVDLRPIWTTGIQTFGARAGDLKDLLQEVVIG